MKQTIYVPVKVSEEVPERRKEISDYSIKVIGVFSDQLVDFVYYNYHKKEWNFSDGDDFQTLKLLYWLKEITLTKDEIRDALGYPKEYVQAMIKDFQKGEKVEKEDKS